MSSLEPSTESFDKELARRVRLTVSCTDCDELPKVENAGSTVTVDGVEAQVMHNGILVEKGGYFGDWMAEIIRCLEGHHEPQEEIVFAKIIDRLRSSGRGPQTAIELGCFWSFYSLWFAHELQDYQVLAMEPDPLNLDVGRRNFALNKKDAQFLQAVVGESPGEMLEFTSETDGSVHLVKQYNLQMLMDLAGFDHVDLLMCDIQGGEDFFFAQSLELLKSGKVRFAIISTHHFRISNNPLTHQHLLALLTEMGAHIIAEHTVGESYSGDGLIAVAFDEADFDLHVHTSVARQGDSLFGPLEYDLQGQVSRAENVERHYENALAVIAGLEAEVDQNSQKLAETKKKLRTLQASRPVRYGQAAKRFTTKLTPRKSATK